jgi:hypothetical protein
MRTIFNKDWPGIQKLKLDTNTDLISLFLIFQNKENMLKVYKFKGEWLIYVKRMETSRHQKPKN